MINLCDLKTGTKLKLLFNPATDPERVIVEYAYFERVIEDNLIEIHSPSYVNIFPTLVEGSEFQLHVILIETIGIFACKCVVDSYVHDQNNRFLRVRVTSKFERIQRRNDFRLEYLMKVILFKSLPDIPNEETKYIKIKCITRDISGGGMAVYTNANFAKGERGLVSFTLEDKDYKFPISVRYIEKMVDESAYKHCLGIQFDFEFQKDKESIIQSIFKIQRQHLLRLKQYFE